MRLGESSTAVFRLKSAAEQLSRPERWRWLLSVIFRNDLGGRLLKAPPLLESLATTTP
jgi:hypothetical protein